jgi:transposase-like protein
MKRNLTLSQAIQIREMRRQGVPIREVCRLFNTNANTVYQIQVGMAYREAASVEGGQASVDGTADRLDSTVAREGAAANVAGEPTLAGGIKGEE